MFTSMEHCLSGNLFICRGKENRAPGLVREKNLRKVEIAPGDRLAPPAHAAGTARRAGGTAGTRVGIEVARLRSAGDGDT